MINKVMSKYAHFYVWYDKNDNRVYVAKKKAGGFSLSEVNKIAPQLIEASKKSQLFRKKQHIIANLDKESFYVYINFQGLVFLPRLENGKRGKTLDSRIIYNFRTENDWYEDWKDPFRNLIKICLERASHLN